MVFRPRRGRKNVTLNVTSLIDVLFLLLIFFMLTGTFKRVGEMELQLPESSTATPSAEGVEAHQAELVLLEDGTVLLDGEAVEPASLKATLSARVASQPDGRIVLKAESGARHGEVIRLLDVVRESGFVGVSVGTQLRGLEGNGQ